MAVKRCFLITTVNGKKFPLVQWQILTTAPCWYGELLFSRKRRTRMLAWPCVVFLLCSSANLVAKTQATWGQATVGFRRRWSKKFMRQLATSERASLICFSWICQEEEVNKLFSGYCCFAVWCSREYILFFIYISLSHHTNIPYILSLD